MTQRARSDVARGCCYVAVLSMAVSSNLFALLVLPFLEILQTSPFTFTFTRQTGLHPRGRSAPTCELGLYMARVETDPSPLAN